MPRWQLLPEAGGPPIEIPEGRALVVGRAAASDIHLADETVSRHHAELRADGSGLRVRDLASANGTLHNDRALTEGHAGAGDLLTFGRVRFRVALQSLRGAGGPEAIPPPEEAIPPGTSVRALDVQSGGGALARLHRERLARLIDLARQLGGESDTTGLLRLIVEQASTLLPADRVALLLAEEPGGAFLPVHWFNRLGNAAVQVPGSIVGRAVAERSPIVTENAQEDRRFQSGSVATDRVRAALCVPLLGDGERVEGVLYVDSLTGPRAFTEEEAALCFAFGGLAAAGIAKARAADGARRQEVIRANFERFFAPGVAARIAATRSGVRPGGERRPVSVLYSDVRGFTGLAETMQPEAIAGHLSEYFASMVELVFEHGGTLDKFMGDALLAVWGAPLSAPEDPDRALAAARAMQDECRSLNARWQGQDRPRLAIGIGLHYGEAFAGTIGSPRRLEYTVIGDVVNVAARLCAAAAAGEIVLSQEMRNRLAAPPAGVPGEELRVRGREGAVVVYRLKGGM
ncbi:MAG TPA: adenylate/guanylate cyclase domain-containing protein [Gemmatimonadales bacterium]|nr:adenylate/guanylate cyclase domain-containing protein [Gemmatimonadales bacterium]